MTRREDDERTRFADTDFISRQTTNGRPSLPGVQIKSRLAMRVLRYFERLLTAEKAISEWQKSNSRLEKARCRERRRMGWRAEDAGLVRG